MAYYGSILEEELKNKVGGEWFAGYDTTHIIGKIDFAVAVPAAGQLPSDTEYPEYLLWAEAKQGTGHDIVESLVQLILTIGRARAYESHLPPAFLGAFDAEKMAFVPYHCVMDVFAQNDFNWNVAPSDHQSKEFRQLRQTLSALMERQLVLFRYASDEKELRQFIKQNFRTGHGGVRQIQVTINNFTHIYNKWRAEVMPTITTNWDKAKQAGIIDADFYLADLLSSNNATLKEKLFVVLRGDHYELDRRINDLGFLSSQQAEFNDGQKRHALFWNRYRRPPRRASWDRMVERRDLLVPQDVRERKGSFFTPRQWVELSQEYLARELGEDWQDHYYVWDCCAGTGNLLAGLTNKYNIYASTLDKADVEVIHTRIATMNRALRGEHGGSNLLDSHVFQFDFLNDPFNLDKPEESKLPQSLIEILKDEEKRKKLVMYINPPYAEAGNRKQRMGTGKNKSSVSFGNYVHDKYKKQLGLACREVFAQFFIRIHDEIPTCVLAEFSTLKTLQAPNFRDFRKTFRAKLGRNFIVPANTFDNVKGQFPIGFFIWHLAEEEEFLRCKTDIYESDGTYKGQKNIHSYANDTNVIEWLRKHYDNTGECIAYLRMNGTNVQNNLGVYLTTKLSANDISNHFYAKVTRANIRHMAVYFAIRQCIPALWLNDRDQYLVPNDQWGNDEDFINDCLALTLLHGQNRISYLESESGANHWIPFTEAEVDAKEAFKSHFMSDYLRGRTKKKTAQAAEPELFDRGGREEDSTPRPVTFSAEAQAVMDAGRELWRYYHRQESANPNAALYDMRLHFQGVSGRGTMNASSADAEYTRLIAALRQRLRALAAKIEPRVYDYGFLRR